MIRIFLKKIVYKPSLQLQALTQWFLGMYGYLKEKKLTSIWHSDQKA